MIMLTLSLDASVAALWLDLCLAVFMGGVGLSPWLLSGETYLALTIKPL
jgi:hypothetical protein